MLSWPFLILLSFLLTFTSCSSIYPVIDSRVLTNEISDYDDKYPAEWTPKINYKFLQQPEDTFAVLGSSVTLACIISNPNVTVQWTKNNFGLGTDRNLSAYSRYSMIGEEISGNFSLFIKDVNFEDEGHYQCQFSNQIVQMRSNFAILRVLDTSCCVESQIEGSARYEANAAWRGMFQELWMFFLIFWVGF